MFIKRSGIYLMAALLVGSEIQINVPPGGAVSTTSGAYECVALQSCEADVVGTFFSETFKREAEAGYFFHEWRKAKKYFCGGKGTAYSRCFKLYSFDHKRQIITEFLISL